MEKTEYAILSVIAAITVGIGVFTTTQPLGQFFVESTRQFVTTTAAMAWITWWALVVGFAIAGGVEAWTSDEQVADLLEGHGLREIGYGSLFGFVSSSCSYSAIATAKNLFKKGGSAAATLGAFMFASTNLVIEIGAVMWILLGWEFLLADIVGGFILIGMMAVGLTYVVPDEVVEQARENIEDEGSDVVQDPVCGMEVDPDETDFSTEVDGQTYYFCSESCQNSFDPEEADTTITEQATSMSGWRALADKQWKEWGMLWDEIAIGFVFAGLIAGFIPEQVWTSVFSGQTFGLPVYVFWTAVLGAVIGIATFVCSVGNVPFAAVLFSNGLPFGSVLSYIYADLIVPPIMDAYREYYGTTFAAILSGMIFVSAVVTGFIIHFVFLGLGFIPDPSSVTITEISIELNYKMVLNVLATGVFLFLYWLHRSGAAEGEGEGGHGEHGHAMD
ncbi:permease [Candidatus Halobonum tyrrellensis]|uniref:Putative metal ion permease n=1 Tax=Candidatus Halobonum tyrrellensis G22 TaxID=1324957 RepID=V4HGK1_9EURY|nr:permease [Candidatus Halobonum tyrrellensis]ESP89820.1 putative metal ion permease [Candidatus Halobonum tyrrellensis G22]